MNQFKFFNLINFEYPLKIYESLATSMQTNTALLATKQNIHDLNLDILIASTFLQMYAQLEESLYCECAPQLIKKNASISRFATALTELGYCIDNAHWHTLVNFSKIRNCLLHGNGRLDNDRYGVDTTETIHALNHAANAELIAIIHSAEGSAQLKIKEKCLYYYLSTLKNFLAAQK
jgi:hypothetical protein